MFKKIFFVGDFCSNTGPSIVNKNIKTKLGNELYYYSISSNKIIRIFELLIKILFSKNVCFSGFSNINYYGIKICKFLNKRCFYLMHGYLKKEYEINKVNNDKKIKLERYILNNVNKVICVSEPFMDYLKNEGYKSSFAYIYCNIPDVVLENKNNIKDKNLIMSTGGLTSIKNNLIVCKAIELINKNRNSNNKLKYIIVGNSNNELDKIKDYDFLTFYETIPHEDCLELMKKAYLYIQNSYFESFNLSVLESLMNGCNVLFSTNLGIKGIFKNIDNNNIIENVNDMNEIAIKINKILNEPNYDEMINSIDFEIYNEKNQFERLIKIICDDDVEG